MPPSGRQHVIERGTQRAVVTEVGATLRSYTVEGIELLDTFSEEAMCDSCRGQVLAPWPNRIDHGRYRFAGQDRRLSLSEPERDNAIHGLVRWLPFDLVGAAEPVRLQLSCLLYPQDGYEFMVLVDITYALSDEGLGVLLRAHNRGSEPAPFGAGYHPYLAAGSGTVDDTQVRIPAATVLTTNDRLIPTGEAPVEGTSLDFRSLRPLGDARLDLCFTDLARDDDGMARVELAVQGRPAVAIFMDEHHDFLQVYTGDTLEEHRRRRGLAVEPMTCAPDAFNNGRGLRVLEPEESFDSRWGISTIA